MEMPAGRLFVSAAPPSLAAGSRRIPALLLVPALLFIPAFQSFPEASSGGSSGGLDTLAQYRT
jgi:hypothetical protein